jgi:hypothetical protein
VKLGVDLTKLFCVQLLTLFCKLDHFINVRNICFIGMKRSSLQYRISKFTPKKFYEIDPWLNSLHINPIWRLHYTSYCAVIVAIL